MKRLMLATLLGGAFVLSGCEDPAPAQIETAQPPIEAMPAADPEAALPEPENAQAGTLDETVAPPNAEQSQETVKPESETLFY